MTKTKLLRLLALSAALAVAPIASASAAQRPPLPPSSLGAAFTTAVTDAVRNFSLVDQNGRTVSLSTWNGKEIFMVPFLSLCQDTCPFTAGNVLQLEAELGASQQKVHVILFDVDPYRDTPARLSAYSKMIGAAKYSNLSFVTFANSAAPIAGDNAYPELSTFTSFFGMAIQKVAEDTPAAIDWWTHVPLTYDINHSDGFYIIDSSGNLRFASGNAPQFHGSLNKTLVKFLSSDGLYTLHHPTAGGWTPSQALGALSYVAGFKL